MGELPYSLCYRTTATRKSVSFAKKVLLQVAAMFPMSTSPHIHLGGDEVPSNVPDGQIVAFFSSLFAFLQGDLGGRRAVVWDEVLAVFQRHGSVQILRDHRVIVQAWQSGQAVRRALSAGLETVASPMEFACLNYKSTSYNLMQTYDPLLLSCDRTRERLPFKGRSFLGQGPACGQSTCQTRGH